MSEAARSPRSDLRFDPVMGSPTPQDSDFDDPLAELARLVGQDDPFRNLFRGPPRAKEAGRTAGEPAAPAAPPHALQHDADEHEFYDEAPQHRAAARPLSQQTAEADEAAPIEHPGAAFGLRSATYDPYGPQDHMLPEHDGSNVDPAHDRAQDYDPAGEEAAYAVSYDGAAHRHDDPAGQSLTDLYGRDTLPDESFGAPDVAPAPLTPDLWAQGEEEVPPQVQPVESRPVETGKAARRPLVVLAAVMLLTGGGLAATFLVRNAAGPMTGGKTAPTILAAVGPNKVKLAETPQGGTAPEDADAALLNKNASATPVPVKVVDSEEQPSDLNQLPKSAVAPAEPAAPQNSAFPTPKKVKTFLVRADGTIIGEGAGPTSAALTPPPAPAPVAPPAPAEPPAASLPSMAVTPVPEPVVPAPTPRPATPKTATRAATTPRSAPKPAPEGPTGDTPPARARQAASPGVRSPSKAKPIEVADAGNPSDATLGSGGAFGVQLAASPSEQDAREAFARLQRKFPSELASLKASVHKAESGDHAVYRVRVNNLSQEEAKTLCTQLQAGGGSCYVVH